MPQFVSGFRERRFANAAAVARKVAIERGRPDAEVLGEVINRDIRVVQHGPRSCDVLFGHGSRPAAFASARSCRCQPRDGAFLDHRTFELGEGGEDLKHQPAELSHRRGVAGAHLVECHRQLRPVTMGARGLLLENALAGLYIQGYPASILNSGTAAPTVSRYSPRS